MKKDAQWYKKIAENGYPKSENEGRKVNKTDFSKGQSSWAFFPGYPIINRWVASLFSITYEQAAFITSILFSMGALIFCYLFFHGYWEDTKKAFWGSLLIMLFPFQFYQSMFLTEAPFLMFMAGSFYAVQNQKPVLLILLLVPLVLIRPNGLIILLPLYLFYLERANIPINSILRFRKSFHGLALMVPAVIAFLLYGVFQYNSTGFFLAFSQAQQGWDKSFLFPLASLFRYGDLNAQVTSWYVILLGIFLAAHWRKMPLSFNALVWISLLLPLSAGSTNSIIRYMSVVFPVFMLLTDMIMTLTRKKIIMIVIYLLHMGSFVLWLNDNPLGY
ncbi:MAG: hypothetical protein DWQ02_07760 [Bacteroidetes bacterium]|nr:MAG: hypothetical protein DWQ02_07760 [Bacteroidota bacterium]